ncbi:MAG: hypothetical protein J6W03_04950, partial [Bacteroidaceae bacterium]|nr:hypothetical protein [Bacteroidaceae bacterium]
PKASSLQNTKVIRCCIMMQQLNCHDVAIASSPCSNNPCTRGREARKGKMREREDGALIVCGLNRLPELLLSAKSGPEGR